MLGLGLGCGYSATVHFCLLECFDCSFNGASYTEMSFPYFFLHEMGVGELLERYAIWLIMELETSVDDTQALPDTAFSFYFVGAVELLAQDGMVERSFDAGSASAYIIIRVLTKFLASLAPKCYPCDWCLDLLPSSCQHTSTTFLGNRPSQ